MLTDSVVEGMAWPGIPRPKATVLAALMMQLEQSQFYAPDDLFHHQRHQLGVLLRHTAASVPFYAARFQQAKIRPDEEITPEALRRIPILTRTEFQAAEEGSTSSSAVPKAHGKPYQIKTSGSTGRPVVMTKTPMTDLMWLAFAHRAHRWHDRDLSRKGAVIRYMEKSRGMPPDGIEGAIWGNSNGLYIHKGPGVALNIASRLQDQAEWLIRQDPHYIFSYPSNLLALAEYFERQKLVLPSLQQVATMSEVLTPQMRAAFRRAWGVPAADAYSCEEAGYLAVQCPDHDHHHVQAENVYLEVVDEAGDPCAPGATGRVLITSLHNFATPLIRYEVGDYAEVGELCSCGRGLPVLTRIHGRARNRLILPDGRSEFPYLGEHADFAAITTKVLRFQYIQRSVEEVEKKMVVTEPLTPEEEARVKILIAECLGHPFRVTLSYHDDIPLSPNGKFEEFLCEVERR